MADSQALTDLHAGLKAVDNVLSFAKSGVGKPLAKERSLFVASVALSYAVWENYVEEVAIEVTRFVSQSCSESLVPPTVREWIMKGEPKPDAWDLAVYPGWRELWLRSVRTRAKGSDDNERDFGMLSADQKNVRALFDRVGVDPFGNVNTDDLDRLAKLVSERGEIVHTGKAPMDFYKQNAVDWRTFVEKLAGQVDKSVRAGASKLSGGGAPW